MVNGTIPSDLGQLKLILLFCDGSLAPRGKGREHPVDSERGEKHGKKCFCSPHIHPLFLWRGTEQGPDPHLSPRQQQRHAQQHAFEQQFLAVCRPYVGTAAAHHTLCERVERFLPELFVFLFQVSRQRPNLLRF